MNMKIEYYGANIDGMPNIYSARWAGDTCEKLVHELNGRESEARYYTCLCYVDGYDIHTAFQGMYGKVKPVPKGNNGFDYDSYFYPFRNNYEKSYYS